MKASNKVFLAMGAGAIVGILLHSFFPSIVPIADKNVFTPIGQIFLKLIQFLVVPTVLFSLITGMSGMRDPKKIGRYSVKLIALYVVTAILALVIGTGTALLLQPGHGLEVTHQKVAVKTGMTFIDWLLSSVPDNPFGALNSGQMIPVIVTAILVGIGIVMSGEQAKPVLRVIESAEHVTMSIMTLVLRFTPVGVFALMTSLTATMGWGILKNLSMYVIGLIIALAIMGIGVYSVLMLPFGIRPLHFFKSFLPAFSMSLATASSNATLPVAMENAEQRFGLSREITGFAIPFGTTLKKDGAAILQGFNAVFIAQLFGLHLSFSQYAAIFAVTLIVSFSTAGVPGAGIIMMSTVLTAAGLPLEGIALVAGVDRLTDLFRTTVNVIGNLASAAILQAWEERLEKRV